MKSYHVKDSELLKHVFDQKMGLKTSFSRHRIPAVAFCGFDDQPTVINDTVTTIKTKEFLDMKKVNPPMFSGDLRSFAKFRADFKMMMEPRYPDKTHQAYILKQNCLKGEALDITKNLNDVNAIWERLHDRYGDEVEIMNTVIKEIEDLPQANTNQSLVKLVNILEKGMQDLEIIDMSEEVANVFTVKLLEKKLSQRVLQKWLERESLFRATEETELKRDGKTRFNQIFKFLKEERRQTERLMSLKPDTLPSLHIDGQSPKSCPGDAVGGSNA